MTTTTWTPRETIQPSWLPLPPLLGKPAPLEALVAGETLQTERGTFFRSRLELSLNAAYGGCRLGDFLRVSPHAAAALARAPELAEVPLDNVLFLDTETTGLAGGTGTYAFMVGLGYFTRSDGAAGAAAGTQTLVVDQCVMRSYGEERAMLTWLAGHMQRFAALVTFNGRTFDVPLLQTRFLMNRMRLDLEEWLHFDLLHAARRIWRPAVQSCALQNLEKAILRVGREQDIESFLIPAIYHQYLRDGDGRYLQRVFNHNRADILAMVALATRACGLMEAMAADGPTLRAGLPDGMASHGQHENEHDGQREDGREQRVAAVEPAECVGLARVFEQLEDWDAAERAYRTAIGGRLRVELRVRALMGLAALLKRRRRHEDAAECWQSVAEQHPAHSVSALIELSKYWEHRKRDAVRAHELARRAHDRWRAGQPAGGRTLPTVPGMSAWRTPAVPPPPDDFARRLARLERKQAATVQVEVEVTVVEEVDVSTVIGPGPALDGPGARSPGLLR